MVYPLTIIHDRYGGAYSGGQFTAWNMDFHAIPQDIDSGDIPCMTFWDSFKQGELRGFLDEPVYCGKGRTIQEALEQLEKELNKE